MVEYCSKLIIVFLYCPFFTNKLQFDGGERSAAEEKRAGEELGVAGDDVMADVEEAGDDLMLGDM